MLRQDGSAALDLPAGVFALAFLNEDDGRVALAAWDGRHQQSHSLSLPCPAAAARYEVLDEESALLAQGEAGAPLSLELTNQVVYVEFMW